MNLGVKQLRKNLLISQGIKLAGTRKERTRTFKHHEDDKLKQYYIQNHRLRLKSESPSSEKFSISQKVYEDFRKKPNVWEICRKEKQNLSGPTGKKMVSWKKITELWCLAHLTRGQDNIETTNTSGMGLVRKHYDKKGTIKHDSWYQLWVFL